MNVLITTLGSYGDVYPFVGLGVRLRHRGHNVTLLKYVSVVRRLLANLRALTHCWRRASS